MLLPDVDLSLLGAQKSFHHDDVKQKKKPKQIRKTDQKLNAFGFATQQNADNHQCERALTNLGEGNQEHVYRRGKTSAASAEKSGLLRRRQCHGEGPEKNKNLFSSQPSGSAHLTFPRRPDTKTHRCLRRELLNLSSGGC